MRFDPGKDCIKDFLCPFCQLTSMPSAIMNSGKETWLTCSLCKTHIRLCDITFITYTSPPKGITFKFPGSSGVVKRLKEVKFDKRIETQFIDEGMCDSCGNSNTHVKNGIHCRRS
jgi:hypothetical protein